MRGVCNCVSILMNKENMEPINISRQGNKDKYFRYTMPALSVRVYYSKTVIGNLCEVAKAIGRPCTYILKHFSYKFMTNSNEIKTYGRKNSIKITYELTGSFDVADLQASLQTFIIKYVLCTKCNNPETEMNVLKRRRTVSLICRGNL